MVLDEVDQMLDMGFAEIVDEILKYAYQGSATGTAYQICNIACTVKIILSTA